MFLEAQLSAFVDELQKIAASHGLSTVSKARSGKRPISVANLLQKDKEGTLYKKADLQAVLAGPPDPGAARKPKKKGDVPTRDDPYSVRREDARDNAATIQGLGFEGVSPTATSGGVKTE